MNIDFRFTLGKAFEYKTRELSEFSSNGRVYFYHGFSRSEFSDISKMEDVEQISHYLPSVESDFYILFIYEEYLESFYCFNDRSGHNEIYFARQDGTWNVFPDIDPQEYSELDYHSVNEYLIFHSVLPPRTMYAGVQTIPMASFAKLSRHSEEPRFKRYWQVEDQFNPKATNYKSLTNELREACLEDVKKNYSPGSGIALSGGIDSGAILGMMNEVADQPIPSFSFGPHGQKSNDLESARKTAKHFNSPNQELYPSDKSFDFLFSILPKLNHPVPPDILLPLCHIFKAAQLSKTKKIFFGYGVQANLGNLGFNQMWHRLWFFDLLFPKSIKQFMYSFYARYKGLSANQTAILMTDDWVERFLYNQGALFTREKQLYKMLEEDFIQKVAQIYEPFIHNKSLKLSDRFVLLYIFGWTHHSQERDTPMIAKHFGVEYCCPFNSRLPLEIIFKTPDSIRKKNKWKKQLWRDVFRPFIPNHLYQRKGKSLVVPYSKLLEDEFKSFLPYLESHSMIPRIIDLDLYEKEFLNLPEPGLNLIRLVSFGIWYDARHDKEHLSVAKKTFESIHLNYQ